MTLRLEYATGLLALVVAGVAMSLLYVRLVARRRADDRERAGRRRLATPGRRSG